ncbi:Tyrosine recombinase XerD [Thalassoglobus neptunius]|uniref:Tyrosine recombinase XerD n=1 Tax=Thalassoglobus neptunius TaxID=1938619 RepID=A0A5C5X613_9PLAN|nr:phage integrase N-terminal SAM-like domain-containing protein [Thalassoglobus neptunius]TWT57693.1 Tyrosine recombinase XerD [Thalassoglobus neptunius]
MALKSALLDQIKIVCRRKGYSRESARTYRHWCEQYVLWLRKANGTWIHPGDCGRDHVEAWLTDLAVTRHVSATSPNVAFQSVLFLYREVLHVMIGNVNALRAKRPQRSPTILSPSEVSRLLQELQGRDRLIGQILYGCGLRIGEAVSLRMKDIDIEKEMINVRAATQEEIDLWNWHHQMIASHS